MSDQVVLETPVPSAADFSAATVRCQGPSPALLHDETQLLVSVVLPLPDHRGNALRSVRSWAREQSLSRDRYEVLVVADGSDPGLEAAATALLAPHDRLVYGPPGNETELYDVGARQARGRWLFFTEAHGIGAADCLKEMVQYLAETGLVGASCRSEGFGRSVFARLEERQFDQAASIRLAPSHWSKLFIRGAALEREIYLRHGGLKARYRLFAEPELSSRLHAAGYRIGFVSGALVRHGNMETVAEMREALHEYARGEATFRLDHPRGERDHHFGVPGWWSERILLDAGIERYLWRSLLSSLACPVPNRPWARRAWLRLLPRALFGHRVRIWAAELGIQRAAVRCWWWRRQEERLFGAYMDLWSGLATQGALRTLTEAKLAAARTQPTAIAGVAMAELTDDWLAGFHALEEYDGERFRWAGPLACIKLPLVPGNGLLRLRTRGLRPGLRARAFLNGHRLMLHDRQADRGEIALSVRRRHFRRRGFQYLALLCDPLKPWMQGVLDTRELGLPLFRVDFDACAASSERQR